MVLSRNQLFLGLFIVLVCPFFIYKSIWILRSEHAEGVTEFIGHNNLGSVLGITTYPVIMFIVDKDTFHFNGNVSLPLERDQHVPVRYQRSHPEEAKIDTFISMWGDTIAYTIGPLLLFTGLFFTKEIAPKGLRILTF